MWRKLVLALIFSRTFMTKKISATVVIGAVDTAIGIEGF